MIIHRLTIRNYRGVDEAAVEFSPVGITLIEGDNEVGKTSLIEALHNIFEYPDNSRHRNIEVIKPTHRDEGPEITLEAEAGPYHFTYFKRFHRKPATELKFIKPSSESSLTSRAAHDRAEQILKETVDWDLWKAVGVQQGEGISQANLKDASSLAAALDKAAGGEVVGDEESSLFDQVEKEYRKYYTGTGKEGKDLETAGRAVQELESRLTDLQRQALEVEKDTGRASSLKEEVRTLEETVNKLKTENREARENLVRVEALEGQVRTHELELENLERDCDVAQRDLEERGKLIKQIADREKEIADLTSGLNDTVEKLKESEEKVAGAMRSLEAAAQKQRELRVVRDLRQKDFEYYRDSHDLELMEERKTRIDEARARAKGAGTVLEKIRITEDVVEEILAAEKECDSARARLQVGAPSLTMRSLKAVDLEVDGKKVKLRSGQEELRTVTNEMSVVVPDVLEFVVSPGTSSEGLGRRLQEVEENLADLLEQKGVKDSSDARKQIQAREKAVSQIEEVKKVEKQDLRDLTYEELTERIEGLKERTDIYLEDRVETPPIADNQDSARIAQLEAEKELEKAEQDHDIADSAFKTGETARNKINEQAANAKGQLTGNKKELADMTEEFEKARKSATDSDLDQKLAKARTAAGEKRGVIGLKKEELSRLNPEQVRALVETTEGSRGTGEERLRKLELEQAGLASRLSTLGEEGLHEKIQKTGGDLFRKQRDNGSLLRRAAAAGLLYTTMKEEQDKAYESYKAPFKDKIEQLGRMIYNDTFQVVLNDDLSIRERVLDRRTVPFESLSGGAKEQLSMLARIAAAMLVSEDKPVPIIIDDALGYTDPGRLKLMGAALAQAGKTGQVIVLTCTPERYAHLGKAELVSMRSTAAGDN